MNSVIKQVSTSPNYCSWMQNCATQMAQQESQMESERLILRRAIHSVRQDGDDWCDEQSVGWYLAVFTYMHCLAYGTLNFEALFLKYWRQYLNQ